ncbi:hypothetical protein [Bradyrhizobium sp. SZCCHNR1075]|uniref:hypothetical protein n=1 Tax=Bradyrhizobium sp. SZCCHNR1075 TaxID=3057362 RepID=UPI0028F02A3A|nr:hypothetical protein [Bradyrhizobium sp. SZCCHNR1075]
MSFDHTEFLEKNFEHLQSPQSWYSKGLNLRRSARYLYKATLPDIRRYETARRRASRLLERSNKDFATIRCRTPEVLPIIALYGLALENVFKAVMVHRNPKLIASKKMGSSLTGNHDLVRFADHAKVSLSSFERQLLDWTSEVVVWKGRYEVPLEAKKLGSFWALDHSIGDNVRSCTKTLEAIFDRGSKQLPPKIYKRRFEGYSILVRT